MSSGYNRALIIIASSANFIIYCDRCATALTQLSQGHKVISDHGKGNFLVIERPYYGIFWVPQLAACTL